MGPAQDRHPLPTRTTSSSCLSSAEKHQPKNKSNQRSGKMQKQRKTLKTDKIITLYLLSKVKALNFLLKDYKGLPRWLSGQEATCQCRRPGFDPWVGEIPWRRKWQPSPVFWPGEPHGQRSLVGYGPWDHKSQTPLSKHTHQQEHLIPLSRIQSYSHSSFHQFEHFIREQFIIAVES